MLQYLYALAFWKDGEGRSSHKMHGKSCKYCIITGVKSAMLLSVTWV